MSDTIISDAGSNDPPLFRVTSSNNVTTIRDYATNTPRFIVNGTIGGVEVMTTAQRTAITPEDGQLIYDSQLETLYVGDGHTVGGVAVGSGGGGGGATPVIQAAVSGNTASVTLENGGGNVKFVGMNGTTLTAGPSGEIRIETTRIPTTLSLGDWTDEMEDVYNVGDWTR